LPLGLDRREVVGLPFRRSAWTHLTKPSTCPTNRREATWRPSHWFRTRTPHPSNITVTYLKPTGAPVSFNDTVAANSRKTFNMKDKGISGQAGVVVMCTSAGKKIMVERAMYFFNRGAGTDTIGGYSD
jgi:hypothetical protein